MRDPSSYQHCSASGPGKVTPYNGAPGNPPAPKAPVLLIGHAAAAKPSMTSTPAS